MAVFVWVEFNGLSHGQKWAKDHTSMEAPLNVRPENKHFISDREFKHSSVDGLKLKYPFVPKKDV